VTRDSARLYHREMLPPAAAALFDTIVRRRTARAYTPAAVPASVIDHMLEALRWAPSAANRQPWELIVVDDADVKERLRVAYLADAVSRDAAYEAVSRKQADLMLAPTLIVVCGDTQAVDRFINASAIPEVGKEDLLLLTMGAAIQNLLLAATSLGVSTTWLARPARVEAISRILEVPPHIRMLAIVAAGYAVEDPPFHESLRVPIAHKTYANRFGVRRRTDAKSKGADQGVTFSTGSSGIDS